MFSIFLFLFLLVSALQHLQIKKWLWTMVRLVISLMIPLGVEEGFCLWWASLNTSTGISSLIWKSLKLQYSKLWAKRDLSLYLAYYCHSITLINIWHLAFVLISFYLTDQQNNGGMKPVQDFTTIRITQVWTC